MREQNKAYQPTTVRRLRHAIEKRTYSALPVLSRHLTLPDFLGIGMQKSATTWLHHNLVCHPDLFLPASKELHYFNSGFMRPLHTYARVFKPAGKRIKGEITPAYSSLGKPLVHFIRRVRPELRILLLLRNPVDRAWSQLKMQRRAMSASERVAFDAAPASQRFEQKIVKRRGDYLSILDTWFSEFPHEQIFLGYYEDVIEAPENVLRDVFLHLGVSPNINLADFPVQQKINVATRTEPMPDEVRTYLEARYLEDLKRLRDRLGDPVQRWLDTFEVYSGER